MSNPSISSMGFRHSVWRCLPEIVGYHRISRIYCDRRLHPGLNYSVVLLSCCIIEGALEEGFWTVLSAKKTEDALLGRLLAAAKQDCQTAQGFEAYNDLAQRAFGTTLTALPTLAPSLEKIRMLFSFRNVLAHGRAVAYSFHNRTASAELRPAEADLEFKGAYKKIDDYLVKTKVMSHSITERFHAFHYLQSHIADHFAPTPYELLLAIIEGVDEATAGIFESATFPSAALKNELHR